MIPSWVCKARYYCDQWLVWMAIGALALLAYKKDKELDSALNKLEGVMILQQHENEAMDRRMKTLVDYVVTKHP